MIGFYVKDLQDLIEQFSMLGGRTGPDVKIRALAETQNYGTKFDSFGPCAEND